MLKKYIKIEFCGHSPERFINLCRQKQIAIWSLESDTIKYSCCIYAKDFKKLKAFARKSKVKIKIVEKHGLSFVLFRYRKRKWFLLGIMLAFCMMFSLSRFIWNIEIEGNQGISDDVIYDYLKEKRIYSGMKKSKVDCDKICKELRLDFHKIIWVSASLNGTSLKLDIREGKEPSGSSANMEEGHDIISQANGTISSIVTRSGVPNVKKGDTVIKGQVLVSGVIEIKNDAGELIREEKTCADADIWIKTELAYEDTCDKTYLKKKYMQTKKYRFLLIFKENQLEIGFRKYEGNQERTSKFQFIQIGESYTFPFLLGIEKSREYVFEKAEYTVEEQKKILEDRYLQYCKELDEEGMEIVQEEIIYNDLNDSMRLEGHLEVIQQVVDFY